VSGRTRPSGPPPASTSNDDLPEPLFPRDGIEFSRVVALSDGVAAIALTILVLQLALPALPAGQPTSSADLGAILGGLEGPFFAFSLSFVIIAFSWFGHHRFVAQLRGLDVALVAWNFGYLFMLVLVPFASAFIGTYGNAHGAPAFYALVMAALYLVDLPGLMMARHRRLFIVPYTRPLWRARMVMAVIPPTMFLLSIPISLYTPVDGFWFWFGIWPAMMIAGRHRDRVKEREDASAAGPGPGDSL
jgi:uncharacterized membrane protein